MTVDWSQEHGRRHERVVALPSLQHLADPPEYDPRYWRAERVDHAHHGEHERALADPVMGRERLIGE